MSVEVLGDESRGYPGVLFEFFMFVLSGYKDHRDFAKEISGSENGQLASARWQFWLKKVGTEYSNFLFNSLFCIGKSVQSHFQMRTVAARAFGLTNNGIRLFSKLGCLQPRSSFLSDVTKTLTNEESKRFFVFVYPFWFVFVQDC